MAADSAWYRYGRPIADRVIALLALIVLGPILLLIALAIRLSSPGPAVFRQTRVGKDQQEFTMLKFRSMKAGVSDNRHREFVTALLTADPDEVSEAAADDGVFKLKNDDRTTRVGQLIRGNGIDELPQLINVLKGDMALVGPRPAITYEVEHYREGDDLRFAVLPGITGYWQATARNSVDMLTMLDMDRDYVTKRSLRLDLQIILDTLKSAVQRSGGAR